MGSGNARLGIGACVLLAASACAGDAPLGPSSQPAPSLRMLSISWDVPPLMLIGDPPFAIHPRILLSDLTHVTLDKLKCTPIWSSSEPAYVTISAGVLEARRVGDVSVQLVCQDLRVTSFLRVRRRLTGAIRAADTNDPIPGAFVSIASGPDAGAETRTDSSGRFSLIVPTEFDLQASAERFDLVRQHVQATQGTVLLSLPPLEPESPLTFRWEGWFERPVAGSRAVRLPEGTLDGFEFETRHTGEFSLAISASCRTSGNDDAFGVGIYDSRGKGLIGTTTLFAGTIGRVTQTLPQGRYRLSLASLNWVAMPPCTWWLELTRPR